jgi:hypothetical protein
MKDQEIEVLQAPQEPTVTARGFDDPAPQTMNNVKRIALFKRIEVTPGGTNHL